MTLSHLCQGYLRDLHMKIFALGSNGSGQLGLSHRRDVATAEICAIDTELHGSADIPAQIAAGGNHVIVLLSSGKALKSGSYHGNSSLDVPVAWSIVSTCTDSTDELDPTFQFCSATWSASLFATTNNVYTQGIGTRGELGHGPAITQIDGRSRSLDFSHKLPSNTIIVDLASGVHHTVVILSNGDAYGWGNGRKGQIGEPAEIVWRPRRIDGLQFKAVRVVCGREFTYLVGASEKGEHVILGADKWMVRSGAPTSVQDWMDIGAGWGSVFVLSQAGQILSWGRNDHGQLAPRNLPLIRRIAIGSEHVVALTQEGNVIAWGWGEHGNCGPDVDECGDVKPSFKELLLPVDECRAQSSGIGAGCATSWIWAK